MKYAYVILWMKKLNAYLNKKHSIYEKWFPRFTVKPSQWIFACVLAPSKLQVVLDIL